MKLIRILLEDKTLPTYQKLVDKVKKETKGRVLGAGDYGVVIEKDKDRVIKITTDEVELEHAEKLVGKPVKYFTTIYKVTKENDSLGVIEMENLEEVDLDEIPEDFIENLEAEAEKYGIDPDELDYRPENIMQTVQGDLKMVDV